MTNADLLKSLIRTVVPVVVGLVVSGATRVGFEIDPAAVGAWLDGLFIAGYYTLVRAAEHRLPWVGWFLGLPAEPSYATWHAGEPLE